MDDMVVKFPGQLKYETDVSPLHVPVIEVINNADMTLGK